MVERVSCRRRQSTIVVVISDVFFVKQKTAYEMRISDWSSDVCSSDLLVGRFPRHEMATARHLDDRRIGDQFVQSVKIAWRQRDIVEIGRASCRERVCPYV